jgi:hypothetical protein
MWDRTEVLLSIHEYPARAMFCANRLAIAGSQPGHGEE